jgi:hypothetical protein
VPCARLVLRERVPPALLRRLLALKALVVPREADCELRECDVEGQSATAAVAYEPYMDAPGLQGGLFALAEQVTIAAIYPAFG